MPIGSIAVFVRATRPPAGSHSIIDSIASKPYSIRRKSNPGFESPAKESNFIGECPRMNP